MKPKRKTASRTNGRRILFLMLFISACLVLYYYFNKKEKVKPAITYSKPYEPSFKKEGELFFIEGESKDTIKKIHIEVAADDYERTLGLMYRRSMADSLGMLFIFNEEEQQSFWMRNTYISLDIIYINKQLEIVTIHKYTQPLTEWGYPSHKSAMYVVETNAGFCDRHKIKEGDRILYSTVK